MLRIQTWHATPTTINSFNMSEHTYSIYLLVPVYFPFKVRSSSSVNVARNNRFLLFVVNIAHIIDYNM